jgi:alpha-L-rhamnosidase
MYGPIESGWKLDGKTTTVDIEIPPNTHAILRIPSASTKDLLEGGRQIEKAPGVLATSQDADAAVITVGSGRYSFQFSN